MRKIVNLRHLFYFLQKKIIIHHGENFENFDSKLAFSIYIDYVASQLITVDDLWILTFLW